MKKNTKSQKNKVLSIISAVSGLLGSYSMSTFSLIAIIFGHIALHKAKKEPDKYGGRNLALFGLIFGYIGVILALYIGYMEFQINSKLQGL